MRNRRFILFYLLLSFSIKAQDLTEHFRLLNSNNGLSADLVNCVYKDHQGYLWIGTNSGLNRFDGKNVIQYNHENKDSNSLVNNTINSICEDDKGRIWLATVGGISLFDPQKNTFRNFQSIRSGDTVLKLNDFIPSIAYFKKKIFIGLRTGILSTSTDSIDIQLCTQKELHYSKKIRCFPNRIYKGGKGIWISTFAGVFYTEDGINFFNKEYNPNHWPIFDHGCIFSFVNDGDSLAYFGTWGYEGYYKYNYKTAHLDSIAFKGLPNILTACKVGANEIWAGTFSNGVLVLDLKSGKQHFQARGKSATDIAGDIIVNDLYVDEQGTVFSATGLGLYYVNPFHAQFTNFSKEWDAKHTFPPSMSWAMETDDQGLIWMASFAGSLYSYDPKTEETNYYQFNENYNRLWFIYNAKDKLILGSYGGLAYFDLKTKKHSPIKLPKSLEDYTQNGISFIRPISGDDYWIGLWQHGLLRFNLRSGEYRYYSSADSVNKIPANNPGVALKMKNELWIGYLDGGIVTKIDNTTNTLTHFLLEGNTKTYGGICTMTPDKKGNIWAGTLQGGVICLDPKGNIIAEYTTSEGLSNNAVAFVHFDSKDHLWIGTSNGLNKLDLHSKNIIAYTYSDGLPSNQFIRNLIAEEKGGIFHMACDNYLTKFDPAKLSPNLILPKIQLLSIQKSGVNYIQNSPDEEIEVSYNDKVLAIEFTAINFIDPDKTQFAYKLEGFDNNWNYNGKRNYVSFINLPAGNYLLKVKASNQTDNWNVPEYIIRLNVKGPFWKSPWFFALSLLTTFLLAFLIYYVRLKQILKIQAIRDKISKDLHDDIGSSLSSIAIYSEVAKKYSEEKTPEIIPILNSLQETARATMENMSDIVWSINPANDRFSDAVKRLEIFANEILNASGIALHFAIDESLSSYKISMQQRKNIYLICKEAINNVAKYSEARNCTVEMNEHKGRITIQINDDGVGMAETKKTLGGNGIINMKKRAEELKGLLDIISEKNKGTSLSLRFFI